MSTSDETGGAEAAQPVPLTGADLDSWTAGFSEYERPVAAVAGGLDAADLAAWVAVCEAFAGDVDMLADAQAEAGFHPWDPSPHLRSRPPVYLAAPWIWLARPFDTELGYRHQPPPLRLSLRGNIIPAEVVPRLLACPGVGSAVIPVERPPGALRRRELSWPLRIGVVDDDLLHAFAARQRAEFGFPEQLFDVSDLRTDPGLVDLLIIRQPPDQAAALIAESRPLANMVACLGDTSWPWPLVDAHLALIRAVTAAFASILVPTDNPDDIARSVSQTVKILSRAYPVDIAVVAGFDRNVIIAAEEAAFVDAALPNVIRRRAEQFNFDYKVLDAVIAWKYQSLPNITRDMLQGPERAWVRTTLDEMGLLADSAFDHQSDAATVAPAIDDALDAALDQAAEPRLLQAYVGSPEPGAQPDSILRAGENAVDIFIGPPEAAALAGPEFPQATIFDDPAINHVTLTAVLVPLLPRADPVRTELVVPRVGRSRDARLPWNLPDTAKPVQARIVVLYHNRVIQTALLSGTVGAPAKLTERLVLWQALNHLDDRQRFDRAFILNHDDTGNATVISHADGSTAVEALPEVNAITGRIRNSLLRAATETTAKTSGTSDVVRRILIEAAVHGRDLFMTLMAYLQNFAAAKRVQIVSARPGWFLPLELIYDRPAPKNDATLCKNWVAGTGCGQHCFQSDTDKSVMCPSVFWGMSRVIERHYAELTDPNGTAFLLTAEPTRSRRTLTLTHAALAASAKVRAADVTNTQAQLMKPTVAADWPAWEGALTDTLTDLLVLMPHTDFKTTALEISPHPKGRKALKDEDIKLLRGRLERTHVTGDRDVTPVVVLFGCDTAGFEDDPSGYAGRFMQLGAAVVLSTLTMLLNRHAAEMSQLLAAMLLDKSRPEQPVGDLVAKFRRDAVRAGLVSALAVTALGDADWKV